MSKPRNNIHLLSVEQRAALHQFATDFQKVMPEMAKAAQAAKAVHQKMLDADTWSIVESPKPQDFTPPEPWTVGHAKVNYVDHIETNEGAQDK